MDAINFKAVIAVAAADIHGMIDKLNRGELTSHGRIVNRITPSDIRNSIQKTVDESFTNWHPIESYINQFREALNRIPAGKSVREAIQSAVKEVAAEEVYRYVRKTAAAQYEGYSPDQFCEVARRAAIHYMNDTAVETGYIIDGAAKFAASPTFENFKAVGEHTQALSNALMWEYFTPLGELRDGVNPIFHSLSRELEEAAGFAELVLARNYGIYLDAEIEHGTALSNSI